MYGLEGRAEILGLGRERAETMGCDMIPLTSGTGGVGIEDDFCGHCNVCTNINALSISSHRCSNKINLTSRSFPDLMLFMPYEGQRPMIIFLCPDGRSSPLPSIIHIHNSQHHNPIKPSSPSPPTTTTTHLSPHTHSPPTSHLSPKPQAKPQAKPPASQPASHLRGSTALARPLLPPHHHPPATQLTSALSFTNPNAGIVFSPKSKQPVARRAAHTINATPRNLNPSAGLAAPLQPNCRHQTTRAPSAPRTSEETRMPPPPASASVPRSRLHPQTARPSSVILQYWYTVTS